MTSKHGIHSIVDPKVCFYDMPYEQRQIDAGMKVSPKQGLINCRTIADALTELIHQNMKNQKQVEELHKQIELKKQVEEPHKEVLDFGGQGWGF